MRTSQLIVMVGIVVATIVCIFLLMRWLKRTRRRARKADVGDLKGIKDYAATRGLTVLSAAQKHAFTASGALDGVNVSLTTSHLELVVYGKTTQGPIETHVRARGLPANLRFLVARPVPATGSPDVEQPMTRGVDRLPTGDRAFDGVFQSFAATPDQLGHLLDATARQQIQAIPELREVRLSDGELSISLTPAAFLGGDKRAEPWYHVRPLVRAPGTLDNTARLLTRIYNAAKQLG